MTEFFIFIFLLPLTKQSVLPRKKKIFTGIIWLDMSLLSLASLSVTADELWKIN